MEATAVPRRRDGLESSSLGGRLILYDPASGALHTLNRSAAEIFELCDGSRSVGQVLATLCGRYGVPEEEIGGDVIACLQELREKELVVL